MFFCLNWREKKEKKISEGKNSFPHLVSTQIRQNCYVLDAENQYVLYAHCSCVLHDPQANKHCVQYLPLLCVPLFMGKCCALDACLFSI